MAVTDISALFGMPLWALYLVLVWSLIWKGLALWKSARKKHLVWFVVMLIINTLGILEILYFFIFSKLGKQAKNKSRKKKK